RDVVVGLHAGRSPAMVAAMLGVLKAGGAYLPLDPTQPAGRLALMAEDAACRIVVADRGAPPVEFRGVAHTVWLDEIRPGERAHGVTTMLLTTAFFNAIVDEAPDALKGLRQVIVGGEAMSPAHVARAAVLMPEARFVNGYGPTESTTFAACHPLTFPLERDTTSVPIGRPIAGTEIYVLDAHGQPVPIGVPGELHIGGAGLARGYWNRPELTAEHFVPHPFDPTPGARLYRSGDLARWRPDGTLECLGRLDAQVKIRGVRVEPAEVEAVLSTHPSVREVAVVAANGDRPNDVRDRK